MVDCLKLSKGFYTKEKVICLTEDLLISLISLKADVINFESVFKEHVAIAIMNLALRGFLCSLGIQCIEGRYWFSSFTFY